MPKNRIEAKTAPPHNHQPARDRAHAHRLVEVFAGTRDAAFLKLLGEGLIRAAEREGS